MRKRLFILLTALLMLLTAGACAETEITALSELNEPGMIIGLGQGNAADLIVREQLPNATIAYFSDNAAGYLAVAQGKADAYVYDYTQMQLAIEGGFGGVHLLDETMGEPVQIAVGISPVSQIPSLEDKLNQFIGELQSDGTLDDMFRRWVIEGTETMPEISLPEKAEWHLAVGTSGIAPPYSYYAGTELNGYDIELARRFAAWLGADLQFKVYDYGAIIPAAISGDVDCVMANLNATPERREALRFSDTLFEEKLGIMVRGEAAAPVPAENADNIPAWQAYNGKRLGVLTCTLMEDIAYSNFPDSEYLLLNSYPDCIAALLANKIDAYLGDEPSLKSIHAEQPKIDYIRERITNQEYSFAFRKNDPESAALCAELNAFLALCHQDGTMQELDDIWFGVDEERKVVDMSDLTGENGTIRVVTTSTDMPFSYIKDGKNVGYDIDLVVRFCRYAGYKLELGDVDFTARIPAIQSGKYDFTTDMNVTEERKEQVLFSDSTSSGGVVLAILTEGNTMETTQAAASISPLNWNGRRMGIVTGTSFEAATLETYPNSEYFYYNSNSDVTTALTKNKIDGFLGDEPVVRIICKEVPEITFLPEKITQDDYAFGFGKNSERADKIRGQFNEMLAQIMADGTLNALYDKWFGDDENVKVVDLTGFSGENGTLKVVTESTSIPFSYIKDRKLTGIAIELTEMFCRRYGYMPEIEDVDAAARIPGLVSGKYDMCASPLTITEERKESINFSDPYYQGGIVLAIRKADAPALTAESCAVSGQGTISTLDALNGKRIGVLTGTISGRLVETRLPNAQVNYFNTQADSLAALKTGKIDAWCTDEPIVRFMKIENPELMILDEYLTESNLAAIFPKTEAGQALCSQYNDFLKALWADGTMAEIDEAWFGADDAKRTVMDYANLPAANGTLRMAADLTQPPFTYMKNNRAVGYDIDVAARFCQEYGYGLVIEAMSFDGVLAAVQSGKCDFASSCITITQERAESMLFSNPNYYGGIAMAVLKAEKAPAITADGVYKTLDELNGRNIGVQTGHSFDAMISARLPEATLTYYNNKADLINALTTGKIVSFAADEPVAKVQMQENDKLTYVPEYLDSFEFGYVFAKTEEGAKLRDQMNEYLRKIQTDGTLAEIDRRWFGLDDAAKTLPDYKSFPAPNGTLRLATEALYEPFSYIKNNEIVGYDIDIIVRFCEAYGYGLEIEDMNFSGILPAVQSGKSDLGCAGITITAERAESVYFSDPNYSGGTVMMVLKAEAPAAASTAVSSQTESFWDGLAASFNKTFIREARWKLFLEGVGTTMLITLLSILFGTVLGFVVFMLCRNGNLVANGATRFSIWLVTGTPMVVLLMILYYIIFGSVAISGIAVAVIGFTLTFGAAVFSLLKMGVGTIDRGQYEAAYALGHSNRHTFFKIILPQAIPHVLPAYQGEIVGLIKATAIVGYIAVQDLTKMGDIVRSRTYEAFFPLIAVTVIYFVLEGLFSFAVSRIRVSIDPKKRKRERILKGVNIHD
ncbi:MAG: transporter substrate-binding domain-containing protein [Clostridia bacterium]|nr:transporter substrate-binding domain-containing protein [Clostridia bacterium]